MGLINNFRSWLGNWWLGRDEEFRDQVLSPLTGGLTKNTFTSNDVEKVAAAMTCVKVLSETIARLPINVYKPGPNGRIPTTDPRQGMLHDTPDGMITSHSFFTAMEMARNLKGNAFAKIIRKDGRPVSLELIPPNKVEGFRITRGSLYYILIEGDKRVPINGTNMIHVKLLTKNGIWGINPIEAVRSNLSTLYKSKKASDNYWANNGFSSLFLKSSIPDAAYQRTFKEAVAVFRENMGVASAGTIRVLPPWAEIQQVRMDIIDEQFIASSKYDASQIAGWYGVPPFMIGIFDAGRLSKIEDEMLYFKATSISSIARAYRQEFELKLLTAEERAGGWSIEFVTQALIEMDLTSKTAYYKAMLESGVMSPNDIATHEGLQTSEGGDDRFIASNNLTPLKSSTQDETV